MAGKSGFYVDDKAVMMALKELDGPETKKAALATLRKGANILKRKTDELGEKAVHISRYRKETITTRKGQKRTKIRRISTVKVSRRALQAIVHIMSDYRVKWFETGTEERRTKGYGYRNESQRYRKGNRFFFRRKGKGRPTGKIGPTWFFRKAQSLTENQVFNYVKSNLSKEILRIWNKKNK